MGTTRIIKLPDIGEGVAEAELIGWLVKVGDIVREDQPLAEVMTDKATVEIPSPAAGTVVALGGEVGAKLAVGGELVRLAVPDGADRAAPEAAPAPRADARHDCRPRSADRRRLGKAGPARGRGRAANPPGKSARRQADRVAGRAQAGAGCRHRSPRGARRRSGRPHTARGSRSVPAWP